MSSCGLYSVSSRIVFWLYAFVIAYIRVDNLLSETLRILLLTGSCGILSWHIVLVCFVVQCFILLSCILAVFCNMSQYLCIGRFSAVSFQVRWVSYSESALGLRVFLGPLNTVANGHDLKLWESLKCIQRLFYGKLKIEFYVVMGLQA